VTETIFALSSGAPPAAIAVVRVSGPDAHHVLRRLAGDLPPARHMALRAIRDPASGEILDRGLVVQFPAEASVTGEPLAELHLHGGRAVVEAVQGALGDFAGVRQARPGEFTWRAFENGRLDLLQVESLADLLRAETEAQRRAALAEEGLSGRVEGWRQQVLLLSALVEARLDQSDEDDVPAERSRIDEVADALVGEIGALLARPGAERLFDGVRVVFAGPPNSGKSTLINVLAEREVAIVSPIAGTTRDVIEAPVRLGGVAFVLTDTAGLREASDDVIEREGVVRATRRIADADLVVWMDDASPTTEPGKTIAVHPRADEDERADCAGGRLRVSARTGEGVTLLIEALVERARRLLPREGDIALSKRQREHLRRCHEELVLFAADRDELIAAERLRLCRAEFDALTGRAGTEDMLHALFATFCLGK
jgi:tRNA modification GTPase